MIPWQKTLDGTLGYYYTVTQQVAHVSAAREYEYIAVGKSDLLCLGHIEGAEKVIVGVMRSSERAGSAVERRKPPRRGGHCLDEEFGTDSN